MFEYSIEREKTKALSVSQHGEVTKIVVSLYDTLDKRRSTHTDICNLIEKEIFLNGREKNIKLMKSQKEEPFNKKNWKSVIDSNEAFSFSETRKSFIRDNSYKNPDQIFDVSGESTDNQSTNANIQKEFLIKSYYNANGDDVIDKAMDNDAISGEMIFFTGWQEKFKEVRRRVSDIPKIEESVNRKFPPNPVFGEVPVLDEMGNIVGVEEAIIEYESRLQKISERNGIAVLRIPEFQGVSLEAIDSRNIVWDKDTVDDWIACQKVHRTYETIQSVLDNELYELSKEARTELNNRLNENNTNNENTSDDKKTVYEGNTVKVLHFQGDFVFDGITLKNWTVSVLADKYLILFEANRFVICPYVMQATVVNPETGRGVPNILSILGLIYGQDKLLNDIADVSSFKKNPSYWVPKGSVDKTSIEVYPGHLESFNSGIVDPNSFIRMNFEGGYDERLSQSYQEKMHRVSGVNPNMLGQNQGRSITATELNAQVAGQTARLNYDVDKKTKGIIQIFRNIADLNANNYDSDQTFVTFGANRKRLTASRDVMLGDYEYTYNDRSVLNRKRSIFQELMQFFEKLFQNPEFAQRADIIEIYKEGVGLLGLTDADKFLKSDEQMQPQPQQMPQVPPEMMQQEMAGAA